MKNINTTRPSSSKYILFVALILSVSSVSYSDDAICNDKTKSIEERLNDLLEHEDRCFISKDISDLYYEVRLNLSEENKKEGLAKASLKIERMAERLSKSIQKNPQQDSASNSFEEAYELLKANISWAREALEQTSGSVQWGVDSADINPNERKLYLAQAFWSNALGNYELCTIESCAQRKTIKLIKLIENTGCDVEAENGGAVCDLAYSYGANIVFLGYMMEEVNTRLWKEDRKAISKFYEENHQSWNVYVRQQPIMWPWESLGNRLIRSWVGCEGYRYGSDQRVKCYPVDENNNAIGRAVQPSTRYFLFHPEPVISTLPDESDGDKIKVGLAMQWFGAMHTRVAGSKLEKPFGLSLVSVVSDNPSVKKVGHGLMFNWGNAGLSITDHGGDLVYSITLDLLSLIKEKSGDEYIKGFVEFK